MPLILKPMPAFPVTGPLGIVLMLLLGGMGAPFPEELVLIGAGVAAHPDRAALFAMMAAGWVGIVGADLLMYCIGRFLGAQVLRHPILSRHLSPEKLLRFEMYLAQKGPRILLVLRFMTGLRSPAYFSAGAMRFSPVKFVIYDGLAALVSVPLMCGIGFALGDQVKALQDNFSRIGTGMLIVALSGLVAYFAYRRWRGRGVAVALPVQVDDPE